MKMILNEYRLMPWQKEAQISSPHGASSSVKAPPTARYAQRQ